MNYFDREKWINEDCEVVYHDWCAACPYVVYDELGRAKCDKEMKKECEDED